MKRYLYLIWSYLLLQGCTPEDILIEVAPEPSRVVVSSQLIQENFLLVTLSRSFSALAPDGFERLEDNFVDDLLVDSALVTIEYATFIDTLFEAGPGIYAAELSEAIISETYRLVIYDSLNEDYVTATTQLMPQVRLEGGRLEEEVFGSDTIFNTRFVFTDPEEPNWYITQATQVDGFTLDDLLTAEIINDSLVLGNESVPPVFDEDATANLLYTRIFSDLEFDSSKVERSVNVPDNPGDTLIFNLINITEGYFRYLDAQQRNDSFLASISGEPINFPTNVENGFGYFTMNKPSYLLFINEQ